MKSSILAVGLLALSACVTVPKEPQDAKPYVATVPPQEIHARPGSDSIPGAIVVKCRNQYEKQPGKLFFCGPTTVKLTNEMSKDTTEHNFKGDRTVLQVPYDGSFIIEISTKGCPEPRRFAGISQGMGITAQFDNCGTK